MSLNKLTNSADYLNKQFLNIGCNNIKCTSAQVSGKDVVTTAGNKNLDVTLTTTQTVFTQDQELITKKYVDDSANKPTYVNFLKSFTGEFYNDGVVVLQWDGFDEILIRLVNAKSNVYATGLVNYAGSYPSGQHMLLSTVNNDFYQNSSTGQIEFTISCDDDNTFGFYKIRFSISGNNTSYYCYSTIEKFT